MHRSGPEFDEHHIFQPVYSIIAHFKAFSIPGNIRAVVWPDMNVDDTRKL